MHGSSALLPAASGASANYLYSNGTIAITAPTGTELPGD